MTITAPATASTTKRPTYQIVLATIGILIVLMACIAAILLSRQPVPAASTPATLNGLPVCSPQMVSAYPAIGRGVHVHVTSPGPDVVHVGIVAGAMGYERELVQQVPAKFNEAEFSFPYSYGVSAISVFSNKSRLCAVPVPALP
jgi:hypothetical protein